MEPWSRVRVAKCQMLVTSFFILVSGRQGGSRVAGERYWISSTVVPPTHSSLAVSVLPWGHEPGALGGGLLAGRLFGQDASVGSVCPLPGRAGPAGGLRTLGGW